MSANCFSKTIWLNLLCLAAGVAACAAVEDLALSSACLFVFLLLLLCNEAWYWVLAIPTLVATIISSLRGRKDDGQPTKGEMRMVRASALLLILVLPHLLFTLLWGADALLQGGLSRSLGIPLTHGLFACAYIAPGLLGLIGLCTPILPMSVEVFFGHFFEPEDEIRFARPAAAKEDGNTPAATPPALPTAGNPGGPRHPELQAMAGELLYYARPLVQLPNPYTRRDTIIGVIMLLGALFFGAAAVQIAGQGALYATLAGLGSLCFAIIAVVELRVPSRWRAKLSRAEYALTQSHAYIAEGKELRALPIDSGLGIGHELLSGNAGNIHLSRQGRLGRFLKEKLAVECETLDMSKAGDLRAPLGGFYHIADVPQVLELLQRLRAQSQG